MWRNYLTVGYRALTKSRTYAFINIFGLSVGLAGCVMLLVYVRYETSYDAWLPNARNVYQYQSHYRNLRTGIDARLQQTSYVAGQRAKADFPQIERSVYFWNDDPIIIRGGEALATENVLVSDGAFFDVLQFPLVQGDPASALAQAGTVVLTQSEARRLFGTENPVGKTLSIVAGGGQPTDFRVTGIARDVPRNSHLRFTMVMRIDPSSHFADTPRLLTSWGWQSGWFYFAVRPGTDIDSIRTQLPAWERRNIPDVTFGQEVTNAGDDQDWEIVNVRDIHLGSADRATTTPVNDQRTIVTFTIVAFLILGMACINFTNLATARASQRAREIALRKVLGANRTQLMIQFMAESVLIAGLSMLVALTLVELLLPVLSSFLDAALSMTYFGADGMLLPVLLLTVLVGGVGGLYPAFYLSRYQPAEVLRANRSSAETAGSGRVRNALVVGQFAVSIGLIICTAVVYAQTVYARTADPGFRRDGLIQVGNMARQQLAGRSDAIAQEISRVPGVLSVGRSGIGIATTDFSNTSVQVPGRAEPVLIGYYSVDPAFFRTMGINLLAGRLFDQNRPADDLDLPINATAEQERALVARGANIVVSELAARRLGFGSPAEAIGNTVAVTFVGAENGMVPSRIIGVVRDSRFRSIRRSIEPVLFYSNRNNVGVLLVRHDGSDPQGVRARVEQAWKRIAPDVPFDGVFSEERVAAVYQAEAARAQVFAGFALLAVIIACLGLFGLAVFTAERRTREIGIRKVFGARTRDIVQLLAWQFSKPVVLANLIAWPVAWWAMRDWLNGFDARIALTPGPFVLAGLLALVIAIVTVAGHAIRVARTHPIEALRYE